MQRVAVASSNLASIGYDAENQVLEVEFKNGSIYQYEGVPEFAYSDMMTADSLGSYFNANIKSQYAFIRVVE